jgi:hypothetical protein
MSAVLRPRPGRVSVTWPTMLAVRGRDNLDAVHLRA